MKGFLRSKLVLSLAALLIIAAAVVIPLSGSIAHTHAQGSTPFSSTFTSADCASPVTVASLHTGDKVSGTTATLTSSDPGESTQGEDLSIKETNGPFSLTVTVNSGNHPFSFTAASNESLIACITGEVDTDQTATISGTVTSPVKPVTLSFTKTATLTVAPGGMVHYSLTLTNTATVEAHDVKLIDPLPSGLTSITAGPTPTIKPTGAATVDCPSPSGLTIKCTIDNFAPGGVVTITFSAKVDPKAKPGQTITNTATAQSTTTPVMATAKSLTVIPAPPTTEQELDQYQGLIVGCVLGFIGPHELGKTAKIFFLVAHGKLGEAVKELIPFFDLPGVIKACGQLACFTGLVGKYGLFPIGECKEQE